VGQNLHTDILFLESQLQELNDQLTSHTCTTLHRKQVEDRIGIMLCLIEHYRLDMADGSFTSVKRKPPVSDISPTTKKQKRYS